MDLLGSILGNMAQPPAMSEKEREKRKKAREMAKKMEEKQKQASQVFRLVCLHLELSHKEITLRKSMEKCDWLTKFFHFCTYSFSWLGCQGSLKFLTLLEFVC